MTTFAAALGMGAWFGLSWFLWRHGRRHQRAGRLASPWQRRVLWREQRGLCYACRLPLRHTIVEAHHVRPWSQGGKTVLSNLILLHQDCHKAQTALQARRYGWHRR
jgi:5-methylcytosine-specific restriction endonuclease McrA